MAITPLNERKENFVYDMLLEKFYEKLEKGTLDDYTYLLPRIFNDQVHDKDGNSKFVHSETEHPVEDIRHGELLIKTVYENLRKSKHWEDTLLIITYDEHGGYPDHVIPPSNVTSPGDSFSTFSFKRLGVRVPAVAVSPWLKKTTVDR